MIRIDLEKVALAECCKDNQALSSVICCHCGMITKNVPTESLLPTRYEATFKCPHCNEMNWGVSFKPVYTSAEIEKCDDGHNGVCRITLHEQYFEEHNEVDYVLDLTDCAFIAPGCDDYTVEDVEEEEINLPDKVLTALFEMICPEKTPVNKHEMDETEAVFLNLTYLMKCIQEHCTRGFDIIGTHVTYNGKTLYNGFAPTIIHCNDKVALVNDDDIQCIVTSDGECIVKPTVPFVDEDYKLEFTKEEIEEILADYKNRLNTFNTLVKHLSLA